MLTELQKRVLLNKVTDLMLNEKELFIEEFQKLDREEIALLNLCGRISETPNMMIFTDFNIASFLAGYVAAKLVSVAMMECKFNVSEGGNQC